MVYEARLSMISFTENGMRLAARLARLLGEDNCSLFTRCSAYKRAGQADMVKFVDARIGEWAGEQMESGNALIFIGACGIAVRAVAPNLTDKLHDVPVLVIDEKGQYVIPILSGHMGGANELAARIAQRIGAEPVITTATDLNRRFAVDLFAKRNDLSVVNKDGIAKVSSKVLSGQEISVSVETGHLENPSHPPEGVRIVLYPPACPVDVVVSSEAGQFDAAILLKPREYVIGMGCKKGKEAEKIEDFIAKTMGEIGISCMQIYALASIDVKREEQGLLSWSRTRRIPFLTYTAKELGEVQGTFKRSDFVKEQVGVDNVCERAALKASGPAGKLVYEKRAADGMTIAVARREWSVRFDEA